MSCNLLRVARCELRDSSIVSKRCTRSLTLIIHLAIYTTHIPAPCARWCSPSNTLLTYIWASMKREQMWPTKQRIFNAIEEAKLWDWKRKLLSSPNLKSNFSKDNTVYRVGGRSTLSDKK